jgi:aminoglycoside phosphotransferase (APT) family kinase protein
LWDTPPAAEAVLDAAARLGPPSGVALTHGDLHVRHVLVDADGVPAGVIDWGDLCAGDPAIDLSLYWSVLDGGGRAAFRAAYGEERLDPDRLLRARVLALFLDTALALYARDVANDRLRLVTLAGLERTITD